MDGYGMEPGHFIDFTLFTQWTWSILKLFCWSWESRLEVPCWLVFWGCPVTKILKTEGEVPHWRCSTELGSQCGRIFRWSDPGVSVKTGAWSERMQQVRFDSRWTSNINVPSSWCFGPEWFLMFLLCVALTGFMFFSKLSKVVGHQLSQTHGLQLFSLSKLMRFWLPANCFECWVNGIKNHEADWNKASPRAGLLKWHLNWC